MLDNKQETRLANNIQKEIHRLLLSTDYRGDSGFLASVSGMSDPNGVTIIKIVGCQKSGYFDGESLLEYLKYFTQLPLGNFWESIKHFKVD